MIPFARATTTVVLLSLLLLLAQQPTTCHASFLEEPEVAWTYRVGGGTLRGRGLRSGNEVAVSPDGTTLFVTTDDGSLNFLNVDTLRDSFVFEPEQIPGTYMECRSGVTMIPSSDDDPTSIEYVVYSVVDVPVQMDVLYDGYVADASRTSTLSRLLAVNLDGTLRWSVPLNGAVVGNAVLGNTLKDKLYVVHNVPNFIGSSPTRGKVSVVLIGDTWPTVTASVSPLNRHGPFGPATGATVDDGSSLMDVLVVAEAWEQGYALDNGNVFVLKQSPLYDDFNGQGNDAYTMGLISDWSTASATRPAVKSNNDALEVFAGAAGARLSGWTGERTLSGVLSGSEENVASSWDVSLDPNRGNATQPLLVAPILSRDQTFLYQAGASTDMYCIDAQSGDIIWTSSGDQRGTIRTEPKLVEPLQGQPKVYVIEGLKGKVRQHDAVTGAIEWTFDCQDVSGIPCHDEVEADFSVSPSGNTLYYGDIFGKIVALNIAAFSDTPATLAPTSAPEPVEVESTTVAPTSVSTPGATPATTPRPSPGPTTDMPEITESPTWAPPLEVERTQPPVRPAGIGIPFEDEDTNPPDGVGFDDDEVVVVDPNSELSSNAAASANVEENETDSFFSNDIMIILVAVCGGLAMAIIVLLIATKARNAKRPKKQTTAHELIAPEEDGKDWHSAQDEYEEACRKNEEETIQEIVSLAPKTPSKSMIGRRLSKKKKAASPVTTPSTLASIEESPAENELSFVSDATPKNLEKSFEASMMMEARGGHEVSLAEAPLPPKSEDPVPKKTLFAKPPPPPQKTKDVVPQKTKDVVPQKSEDVVKDKKFNASVEPDTIDGPAELSGVEVVAKKDGDHLRATTSRVKSPDSVPDSLGAASDIMSVDGSMYLDDDSKFDVASLSQFSYASTREGGSELGAHYPADEGHILYEAAHGSGQDDHFMEPPRLSSPANMRPLSPKVSDYLSRNQASISPTPMTPHGYLYPELTMSPSPVTPPSERGDSPEEGIDKDVARAGQSVRPSGSTGQTSNDGRGQADPEADESDDDAPRPPVEAEEDDKPEDAWNSFLFELAKAEREFFNPGFGGAKSKAKPKQERPPSPPPPPPPPGGPPDPPVA